MIKFLGIHVVNTYLLGLWWGFLLVLGWGFLCGFFGGEGGLGFFLLFCLFLGVFVCVVFVCFFF